MTKLEETEKIIEGLGEMKARGVDVDVEKVLLADIAKSMAIIADRLCGKDDDYE